MRSLETNVGDDGYIIKSRNISINEGYYPTTDLSDIQPQPELSNAIGNGIKLIIVGRLKLKEFYRSKAYNKGPYMVVNKTDLKTAGRKV